MFPCSLKVNWSFPLFPETPGRFSLLLKKLQGKSTTRITFAINVKSKDKRAHRRFHHPEIEQFLKANISINIRNNSLNFRWLFILTRSLIFQVLYMAQQRSASNMRTLLQHVSAKHTKKLQGKSATRITFAINVKSKDKRAHRRFHHPEIEQFLKANISINIRNNSLNFQ